MKTLILILLLAPFTLAQSNWWWMWDVDTYYTHEAVTGTNTIAATIVTITGSKNETLSDKDNGSRRTDGWLRWKEGALGTWDSTLTNSKVLIIADYTVADSIFYDYVTIPVGGNDTYSNGIDSFFVVPGDTTPTFAFTDVTGVGLSSYNETSATFSAVNDSFWVYAAGDSFKIGALGTLDVGYVKADPIDTIFISLVASASCSTTVTSTVTAGGYSDVWSVTTTTDNAPDAFAFTDVTGAELSAIYQDSIVVQGMPCAGTITISGGIEVYKIGVYGSWVDTPGSVSNGDTVWVSLSASSSYSTQRNATLTINSVSDIFSVTTKAGPGVSTYYLVDKNGNKIIQKGRVYAIKQKAN